MDFDKVILRLSEKLKPSRLEHSIGVMNTAEELAERFGADKEKAKIAGILHDCAKWIEPKEGNELCKKWGIELDEVSLNNYAIVHQYLGAKIAEAEYGVCDKEILDAIRCHATGKKNMTRLEKIIYVSDMIEPNRQKRPYKGLDELCSLCRQDLDKAVLMGLELSVLHVINGGKLVHQNTIAARNSIILQLEKAAEKNI